MHDRIEILSKISYVNYFYEEVQIMCYICIHSSFYDCTVVHISIHAFTYYAILIFICMTFNFIRECTFLLVLDHFGGESQEILSRLNDHPQSLFLFLKTAIDVHLSGNLSIDEFHILKDDIAVNDYLERLTNNQKVGIERNCIQVTDEIIEIYLEVCYSFVSYPVLLTANRYRFLFGIRLLLFTNNQGILGRYMAYLSLLVWSNILSCIWPYLDVTHSNCATGPWGNCNFGSSLSRNFFET